MHLVYEEECHGLLCQMPSRSRCTPYLMSHQPQACALSHRKHSTKQTDKNASSVAQLTNNEYGIPSGPTGGELMYTFNNIFSENTILVKYISLSSSIDDCV